MERMHVYVPTTVTEGTHTLSNGREVNFDDTKFHTILFGGDQLTVARARGAGIPMTVLFISFLVYCLSLKTGMLE